VELDLAGVDALLSRDGRRLVDAATAGLDAGEDLLALTTRLRAGGEPPDLVSVAVAQSRLRLRARPRFGALADRLLWTEAGLEQATRAAVARYRAARFADLAPARVADLCCGVGGDLLALAAAGLQVLGVDRDPVAAAVAAANARALGVDGRVEVRVDDVRSTDLTGCDAAFVDPARRSGGRRRFDPDAYEPPYTFVLELAARVPATAAKLAPGIPHQRLPRGTETEWVSDGGDLKEAAVWWGPLAGLRGPATRRATLLPSGATLVDEPGLAAPPVGPVGRYLHEPDDAVVRAGLVAEVVAALDGRLLDPRIAYVTTDRARRSPVTRRFEVVEAMPFGLRRLRAAVRARRPREVVVKTRGSAVDPDELRRRLAPDGDGPVLTVLLTRVGDAPLAVLARADPG
jgi:SAM-dependent methyltransferase